jgi:hypothetical protein
VGKFCLIGALLTGAEFTGVEQRAHFVELSRAVAEQYGVKQARFTHSNFASIDWSEFNGVYLFNPFQENLVSSPCLDSTVRVHPSLHRKYVRMTQQKLAELPRGARVVTYWGFGGDFPSEFRRVLSEFCYRGQLECWVKVC